MLEADLSFWRSSDIHHLVQSVLHVEDYLDHARADPPYLESYCARGECRETIEGRRKCDSKLREKEKKWDSDGGETIEGEMERDSKLKNWLETVELVGNS